MRVVAVCLIVALCVANINAISLIRRVLGVESAAEVIASARANLESTLANSDDALATVIDLKAKIVNIVDLVETKALSEGQKDLDSVATLEAAGKNLTGLTLDWFNFASDKFYAMQDQMHTIRDDLVAYYEAMEVDIAATRASAEEQLSALSEVESSGQTEAATKKAAQAIRKTSSSLKSDSAKYEPKAKAAYYKAVGKLALILGPAAVRNQITHASLYLYLLANGVTTTTTEAATSTVVSA
jgi:hypothetical protein